MQETMCARSARVSAVTHAGGYKGYREHCVIKKNASQLVRTTEIDYNLKRKGLFLMWNCTTSFLGGADSSDGHAP